MKRTPPSTVNIICPKCEAKNNLSLINHQSRYTIQCSNCGLSLNSLIVYIRAKNSRQIRGYTYSGHKGRRRYCNLGRKYSVRIKDFSGVENLIEFENFNSYDFELRSQDIAVFTYVNEVLLLVQNVTIDRYIKVKKINTNIGCLISIIFGLISVTIGHIIFGNIGAFVGLWLGCLALSASLVTRTDNN